LALAQTESNWQRKGFLKKILRKRNNLYTNAADLRRWFEFMDKKGRHTKFIIEKRDFVVLSLYDYSAFMKMKT
jgi:hypothetical protein